MSTFAMSSNGSDLLRQQFQQLQEQHKKKLLLRKQKFSTQATQSTELTADQKPEHLHERNGHSLVEDVDNLQLQVWLHLADIVIFH